MSANIQALCRQLSDLYLDGIQGSLGVTDEDIEALESECGCALPEDYKAFLKLNDGWHGIHWQVSDLFGVEGEGEFMDRAEATEVFRAQGEADPWVLEVRDQAFVVGAGYRSTLLYMPKDQSFVLYQDGALEETYKTFGAFLQACIEDAD